MNDGTSATALAVTLVSTRPAKFTVDGHFDARAASGSRRDDLVDWNEAASP